MTFGGSRSTRELTVLVSLPLAVLSLASVHAQEVRTGGGAFGTWESDAPAVSRDIRPADLPRPTHFDNDPEAPDFKRHGEGCRRRRKARCRMCRRASQCRYSPEALKQPRVIRIAPNGDVFVAESGSGRVLVFAADAARGGPATPEVFAENLDRPYGIVFHPPSDPQYVYVAAANQVVRFPYNGDRKATGPAEVVIPNIPTKRHWTRDLAVSRDGRRLFVSIGSSTNVAAGMPNKTPEEIQAYEKTHGLGAAWGEEENRAVVRVFDPEGKNVRNYATGLRNCSGMAMQPGTDTLWCTGNERDHIGANLVPDFLTTVQRRRVLRLALVLHWWQRGSRPCRRAARS